MSVEQTVLVLGGTGRTGGRVVEQLLGRGAAVRAIVRTAERLPAGVAQHPNMTVVVADLLSLNATELEQYVRGCDAVVSCLGPNLSLKGVFGAPRDLVVEAVTRVCRAIERIQPATPVKFILMSTVSVNRPQRLDTRRGGAERAFMWLLRGVMPPAKDNQRAADFLSTDIGTASRSVQWVAVRPDSLLEGDVSEYAVHEGLVSSLFRPDGTNMANVAHFMCELVTDSGVWDKWQGGMPVVVNVARSTAR